MATKEELYAVIDNLYNAGFFKSDGNIPQTKWLWRTDKKRKFLYFPATILAAASEKLIDNKDTLRKNGRTYSGKEPRILFHSECLIMVIKIIDDLIENNEYIGLIQWREVAKNVGLILTVDRIDEKLLEKGL